ncbi:MAG: DUF1080 domain-containing protein, partial [Planctomycetota bacterium]|nr:DUF1080 domain-containing protein [Planctomycetota bacterium]
MPRPSTASLPLSGLALLSLASCVVPVQPIFDGETLEGWFTDVPAADDDDGVPASFEVRDGMLVSLGTPRGHLITHGAYADYRLEVEYRWPGDPGNCGVLVHASTLLDLYVMLPRSIEVQMHHGNAVDFLCIGEEILVYDMVERRGPEEEWGVVEGKRR